MHGRMVHVALALFAAWYVALAHATVYRVDNPVPAAGAGFGTSVTGLADVNGDGVPDFAVGVPGSDRVHVFSGFDRTVIRTLNDPDGLTGLQFGYAVVGVGDVDGDGIDDLAVGAPGEFGALPLPCDPTEPVCAPPEWGRAFVFSGATGALVRRFVAASEHYAFGVALAALGDVDGDGVPDVAVGAPELLNNRWGEVYAFSGRTGGQLWVFREPPYPATQTIGSLGVFMAAVGDVNGDGRREVLAAAPFHDNTGAGTLLGGAAYVISGASGVLVRVHDAAPPLDNGLFGGAVAGIADQNGDGVGDYLIGHRGTDTIRLYSGASGTLLRSIAAPADSGDALIAFAGAGDRDGDGTEDFWAGIPAAGRAVLLNGSGTLLVTLSDPGAAPANAIEGFASRLARMQDLNGDGKAELLVAKPGEAIGGQARAGAVYLVTTNRPPVAHAGADRTVPANASCLAQVTLDGTGSSDPDGDTLTYAWSGSFGTASGAAPTVTLSLGVHPITLVVTDGNGGSASDTVVITVADASPPAITSLAATPAVLWPPDHTLRNVALTVVAADNCDAAVTCGIAGVTSNEPANGLGDGDTAPDSVVVDVFTTLLRAERSGKGNGRIYSVAMACRDAAGNAATASVPITVPRSRGP